MDLARLENVELTGADGALHRLGDYWADRPVVLVFLRHFGCLLCREHANQLSERYAEITRVGSEVVAIGTGNQWYAQGFVETERIPYPVLVDDGAVAARAASVRKVDPVTLLLDPRSIKGALAAHRAGFRVHKSGRRVTQLGATFVIGPGARIHYAHVDAHTADHAPIAEVLAALPAHSAR